MATIMDALKMTQNNIGVRCCSDIYMSITHLIKFKLYYRRN